MTTTSQGYRITAATGLHKGDRAYQQDQVQIIPHQRVQIYIMKRHVLHHVNPHHHHPRHPEKENIKSGNQ